MKTRVDKLPAIFLQSGAFLSHDSRDLSRESRDLARFGPFGEAEIWSHDSFPNLIWYNLGSAQRIRISTAQNVASITIRQHIREQGLLDSGKRLRRWENKEDRCSPLGANYLELMTVTAAGGKL